MKNQFVKLLSVTMLLFFISCQKEVETVKEEVVSDDNLIPVTIVNTSLGNFNEYGEYYGRVQGINRASIINILGGTVDSVLAKEGEEVAEGDSLGEISSDEAKLLLDTAKLNEKISLDNYNTQKRFLKNGNTTPLNVDQAHLQYLNSKKQRLEAERAYDGAFCIAPITGLVVSRNIDINDTIHQGQETFLIEDLSQIEITVGIPEGDMNGVEEGSKAEVTIDLYPGKSWEGTLTRLSRRSSDMNLTFTATIVVDNSDGEILSGTTAKVKLLRNSFKDKVIIPSTTILTEKGSNYVMVVNNDQVEKREVIIEASSVSESVILTGIKPGEVIVEEGLHLLVDSQKVTVKQDV